MPLCQFVHRKISTLTFRTDGVYSVTIYVTYFLIEHVCVVLHHLSTAFQSDILHLTIAGTVYSTNMFIMSLLSVIIYGILNV